MAVGRGDFWSRGFSVGPLAFHSIDRALTSGQHGSDPEAPDSTNQPLPLNIVDVTMNISSTLPKKISTTIAKQNPSSVRSKEKPQSHLPRPDGWDLNTLKGKWSNDFDGLTYRRTMANVGAAVGAFASHFLALGAGVALGASFGAGLGAVSWGLGIAGAALGGVAGGYVGAKFQGTTMWGRSALSKAGATVGNVLGRAMHAVKLPLRTNHVDTAERFSVKSLNRYGADLTHTGHARISEREAEELIEKMKPGDVVLTGDHRSTPIVTATQLMTGRSSFSHSIMYKGEGTAVEAVMDAGVREKPLKNILMEKNHAVVIRPDYRDGQAESAVEFADKMVGKKYDFKFKTGNESWYCSELVYAAIKDSAPQVEFDTRKILGKEIVIPNDMFYSHDVGVVGEVGQGRTYLDRMMGKFIAPPEEQA